MTGLKDGYKELKALKKERKLNPENKGTIKVLGIRDFPGKVRMVGRAIKLGTVGQLGKIVRIGRSSNLTKALPAEEHSSEEE
ncbi:MAG: hypothetical protein KAR35_02230 [Candidatus Heimdallarchaeota archaeon]|nr:hypothetical protein [Candidatus Heimdallarchaeota archaeon]MCK5048172.1 hypothetical protein [Candidatus Heimdallarchaeota archaeon]